FAGYSLPDDLLSGTGLRIAYSVVLAVPFVGTWAAFLVFGGRFPGDALIPRLFILHVLLVPALISALLGAHLAILWRQKHTQFPGNVRNIARTEHNVVGSRLWPTYAARSIGLFAAVFAVLCGLGGVAQINPIWLYGPFKASAVTTAAQPDWYVGWLEGALRIFPPWRIHVAGYTISEIFWPAVLLPLVTFGLLYAWPFLEQRVTGDREEHHLLDRPRDRPVRSAVGAGALTFFVVLFVAGAQDVIAQKLSVSIPSVTNALRGLAVGLTSRPATARPRDRQWRCLIGAASRPRLWAVLTSATCENACGKLPTRRPAFVSYSSDRRPTSLRRPSNRWNSASASTCRPCRTRLSASQNEQAMNAPSPPGKPSTSSSSSTERRTNPSLVRSRSTARTVPTIRSSVADMKPTSGSRSRLASTCRAP
ncbi:MAG: cytochrome b, partial [Actinobacteria bacterium]